MKSLGFEEMISGQLKFETIICFHLYQRVILEVALEVPVNDSNSF